MMFPSRPTGDCQYDVVGLGQNALDHLFSVDSYPKLGSKTDALDYRLLPGGQVATATLAAHRMGLRACYVGAVGDDDLGRIACEVLEQDGVITRLKTVTGAHTQFAVIIIDSRGERTIVEHYDPHTVVTAKDLQRELFQSTRALHLDITDVPAAVKAARWAREAGALVSLDIDRLLPGAEELLGLVDLLVASEGLPQELGSPNPRLALHTLQRHCPGFVCITMGERGCVALLREEALWVPAFEVDVVDTTGCGDVFRGTMLHGVLQDWPMEQVLRFAAAGAALQAGVLGAQTGVPSLEQVNEFLESGPLVLDRQGQKVL